MELRRAAITCAPKMPRRGARSGPQADYADAGAMRTLGNGVQAPVNAACFDNDNAGDRTGMRASGKAGELEDERDRHSTAAENASCAWGRSPADHGSRRLPFPHAAMSQATEAAVGEAERATHEVVSGGEEAATAIFRVRRRSGKPRLLNDGHAPFVQG